MVGIGISINGKYDHRKVHFLNNCRNTESVVGYIWNSGQLQDTFT